MSYRSVFKDDMLAGQSIIVTGGGSGIGRCTAHEVAALGARVALVGRDIEKLKTVQAEIRDSGGDATWHSIDIRDEEGVRSTVAEILEQHGRIDGLVNNAGGQFPAKLKDISMNGWEAVVKSNLTGGFLMSREVYTQWMEKNGGNIVNITADFWQGMPDMGHSGAARAGMDNFTKTAAIEWAHSGVRVNSVSPGWIASSGFNKYPDWMTERLRSLPNYVPVGRYGTEAELSSAVVYLLSPAAAYISGESIRVDGAAPLMREHRRHEDGGVMTPEYQGFHLYEKPNALSDDWKKED